MKHCKKMVLNEYSSDEDFSQPQRGGGVETMDTEQSKLPKNSIRAHALNRQRKILTIIRKLAKIDGYNEQGQIKTRNGTFLERSDIATLVLWAVSQDKIIHGLQEFVELLKTAGVTADEVMNENLRIRLDGTSIANPISKPAEPIVVQEKPPVLTTEKDQEQTTEDKRTEDEGVENRETAEVDSVESQEPIETRTEAPKRAAREVVEGQIKRVRLDRAAKPYDRKYGKGFEVSDSE